MVLSCLDCEQSPEMGKVLSEVTCCVGSLTTNSHAYAQCSFSKSHSPVCKDSECFEIKESQWELGSGNPAFLKQLREWREGETAHLRGVVNMFCSVVPQFSP